MFLGDDEAEGAELTQPPPQGGVVAGFLGHGRPDVRGRRVVGEQVAQGGAQLLLLGVEDEAHVSPPPVARGASRAPARR